MTKTIIPILIFASVVRTRSKDFNETTTKNLWSNILKTTGTLLPICWYLDVEESKFDSLPYKLQRCIKQITHDTLDHLLQEDNVNVFDGIDLLKYKPTNRSQSPQSVVDVEDGISNMLIEIGETYLLKICLSIFVTEEKNVSKARFRHRRHNSMPFMMFGIVGMGMILIPMGFKFLAILGGKALLLAKMALILSSIQGLKKVATSNFNYGLYQTPAVNPWHYERNGYENVENPSALFSNGII